MKNNLVFGLLSVLSMLIISSSLTVMVYPQPNNSTYNEYYENPFLGIKLQYPEYWEKINPSSLEGNTCELFVCLAEFIVQNNDEIETNSYFTIIVHELDYIEEKCKCSNLIEFIIWKYENIANSPGFLFFDDKEILIDRNESAWEIEYMSAPGDGLTYNYDVTIQYFDKFYDILFESSSKDEYVTHIKDVKMVINSLEFIPQNQNIERPSFLITE